MSLNAELTLSGGGSRRIQVLIVDDHPLFREGVRRVLEREPDMTVIGEVEEGDKALDVARRLRPTVILMDVNLPQVNGIQLTRDLKTALEDAAVIVVTAHNDESQRLHALRAGASAYFPKDVLPTELVRGVRLAAAGKYVVNGSALGADEVRTWLERRIEEDADYPDSSSRYLPLTARQLDIVKLIALGSSNGKIAENLGISEQTVKNHLSAIFRKLGVHDRTQAVIYALRHGWMRLDELDRRGLG